jgi:hypothetical protein
VAYFKTLQSALSQLSVTLAEKSIECANELGGNAFVGSRSDAYSLFGATITLDVRGKLPGEQPSGADFKCSKIYL